MIDQNNSIMVTVAHIRTAKLCSRGARQWFQHHGLDYSKFLSEGLPIEQIEGTNDALGKMVAKVAREHAAGDD